MASLKYLKKKYFADIPTPDAYKVKMITGNTLPFQITQLLIMSAYAHIISLVPSGPGCKKDKAFITDDFATLISARCCYYGACSSASENHMKNNMRCAVLLPVMFLLIGYNAIAQDSTARRYGEDARIDSMARAYHQQEAIKDQDRKDSDNLTDLKSEKRETRAKAKEAQRVERDANDAARESKLAYRREKKAQKAREQADKQSRKAAKARTKSDKN
jgi:hypothetical protein